MPKSEWDVEVGGETNRQRAQRAERILNTYAEEAGMDRHSSADKTFTLETLIGDILHLCGLEGIDFEYAKLAGENHFNEETGEAKEALARERREAEGN